MINSYSYFIRERGGSWKPLTTWNGNDPPSAKQKSTLIFSIDDTVHKIRVTSKEVPNWASYLKVKTNISQSSKKFLQFTDNSNRKLPIVYGFGFDNEKEAKDCIDVITRLKDRLEGIKTKQIRHDAVQQSQRELTQREPTQRESTQREPKSGFPTVPSTQNNYLNQEQLNKTAPATVPFDHNTTENCVKCC